MRFSLRDFHSSDFGQLWSIDQQCFRAGIAYSRAELSAYMNLPGAFTMLAETAESGADPAGGKPEVLGFVVAHLNRAHAGHIITIDVLPKAQRSGVGSALLGAAEQRLHERGCKFIRLETAVDNESALHFYKRHQYVVVRTIPAYYPDGLDALVLKKNLPSPAQAR